MCVCVCMFSQFHTCKINFINKKKKKKKKKKILWPHTHLNFFFFFLEKRVFFFWLGQKDPGTAGPYQAYWTKTRT